MIKQIQKRVRGLLSSLVLYTTAAIFIENTRCNIVARCFSSAEWPGTKLHTWQLGISHLLASSKEPVCLLSAKKWAKKTAVSHGSPKNPWIWGVPLGAQASATNPRPTTHQFSKRPRGRSSPRNGTTSVFLFGPWMDMWGRDVCEFPWQKWLDMLAMSSAILGKQVGYGIYVSFPWFLISLHEFCWGSLGQMAIGTPAFLFQLHINSCTSMQEPPAKCHTTKRSQQSFWMFSPVIFLFWPKWRDSLKIVSRKSSKRRWSQHLQLRSAALWCVCVRRHEGAKSEHSSNMFSIKICLSLFVICGLTGIVRAKQQFQDKKSVKPRKFETTTIAKFSGCSFWCFCSCFAVVVSIFLRDLQPDIFAVNACTSWGVQLLDMSMPLACV